MVRLASANNVNLIPTVLKQHLMLPINSILWTSVIQNISPHCNNINCVVNDIKIKNKKIYVYERFKMYDLFDFLNKDLCLWKIYVYVVIKI